MNLRISEHGEGSDLLIMLCCMVFYTSFSVCVHLLSLNIEIVSVMLAYECYGKTVESQWVSEPKCRKIIWKLFIDIKLALSIHI